MGLKPNMLASLLLVLSCQAMALASLPPGECFVENQACQASEDNVIDAIGGVDLEECEALCSETEGCDFITFYGPDSYPLYDYCFLFNDCSTQLECDHCVSEVEVCFGTCSCNIEGPLGEENIVYIKFGIESEKQCKRLCSENPACEVYTYFNSFAHTFPNGCFLTSKLQEPTEWCENCNTGYADCDSHPPTTTTTTIPTTTAPKRECGFTIGDSPTVHQTYLFTEKGKTTVTMLVPRICKLTVVAVGGGGGPADSPANAPADGYGGGGSGHVESFQAQLLGGSSYFNLKVGAGGKRGKAGKDTTIDWGLQVAYLRAEGGEEGKGVEGGAGFSGGGAGGGQYGDGGSNGSNGCCGSSKGEGSGLDLSSFHPDLDNFALSPGAGGEKFLTAGGTAGGGGGGVLVDGEAPNNGEYSVGYDGEGYGGGGGFGSGIQGFVLMEIRAD